MSRHGVGTAIQGAEHNDIYPILADMIRWKLDLPKKVRKPMKGTPAPAA